MKKKRNSIYRFLLTCSGEDMLILENCKKQIRKRFAWLGFFVLCIFIGCFFSANFFVYSLFDRAFWISLPVGIIWGTIIVNIYLLLLHTVSPAIIPLSVKNSKRKKVKKTTYQFITLSMFLRLSFMMLLAIIIAQPLNVFILSTFVKDDIEKHKVIERVKLYTLTNKDLIKSELEHYRDFKQFANLYVNSSNSILFSSAILDIETKLKKDSLFLISSAKSIKILNQIDETLFLNTNQQKQKDSLIIQLDLALNDEIISDDLFLIKLNSFSITGNLKSKFDNLVLNLNKLITEKTTNYNSLNNLLNKSNFYVKIIQILLVTNPFSWIITLVICAVFLIPIYSKYKVRDLCAKIFENEKNSAEIQNLRKELINTTNFKKLENKILSINVNNIETSDFYFYKMLIEHKIILEEYKLTKEKYSEKLSGLIKKYNESSIDRINLILDKLKEINNKLYFDLKKDIAKEYINEKIEKYEYWQDAPFRTMRPNQKVVKNEERAFLDFIYNLED
jgi:hypothetical protein